MRPGTLLAHAMEAEGLGETDATFVKEIIVGHGLGADGAFVGRPSRAQRFLYDMRITARLEVVQLQLGYSSTAKY